MKKTAYLGILILSSLSTMCQRNCDTIELSALEDFGATTSEDFVTSYRDETRSALAIDASKYKGEFGLATYTFSGKDGVYKVSIQTIGEEDGESTYRLYINADVIKEVQNDPTEKSFEEQIHDLEKVELKRGATIGIGFNSHTNGKIPEGDITAYSRGRWTSLILTPDCN